jgi:hypothetical protein
MWLGYFDISSGGLSRFLGTRYARFSGTRRVRTIRAVLRRWPRPHGWRVGSEGNVSRPTKGNDPGPGQLTFRRPSTTFISSTAALADARALIKNPALDTGSPAVAGQTYEPPVQYLAAPFFIAHSVVLSPKQTVARPAPGALAG